MIKIPHIVAHRGASIEAPENTIAAFRVAGARGAKWIECDVTLSSDNKCVLIHDDTLVRTTNGTGPIHESDFETLRNLDAGGWFSDIYKGERIPSLADTLETLYFLDMGANLEIKPSGCDPVRLCQEIIAELKTSKTVPLILISSFDGIAVAHMRKHMPELPCGWLLETLPADWQEEYERLGASAIHIDHKALTPVSAAEIVDAGIPLICYTINDVERAKELFSWGVSSVITDDPAKLLMAIPQRPLAAKR
ncbi:glycerophosphodiester phosphodiesterase family protein [Thalassospira sp.]|uniref:glycerophosphodiester phosphodiesterase family protein n=1 Tax=Thalassospira sp. TaxID=1912094 RepID=UPI003AA7B8B3